jgi:hypothetical protein
MCINIIQTLTFFLGQTLFFSLLQMTNTLVLKVTYVTLKEMLKTLNVTSALIQPSNAGHIHVPVICTSLWTFNSGAKVYVI